MCGFWEGVFGVVFGDDGDFLRVEWVSAFCSTNTVAKHDNL